MKNTFLPVGSGSFVNDFTFKKKKINQIKFMTFQLSEMS